MSFHSYNNYLIETFQKLIQQKLGSITSAVCQKHVHSYNNYIIESFEKN